MKKIIYFIITQFFLFSCSTGNWPDIHPEGLKCNNLTNPAGTDTSPVFGWIVTSGAKGKSQSAYQIVLDKQPGFTGNDTQALWNSGKVVSNQTAWISYSGPALEPATRYSWKVRIWDEADEPSQWSKKGYFVTGLFTEEDWKNARWIGYEEIPDSLLLIPGIHKSVKIEGNIATKRTTVPCFRKEFRTGKKVREAFIFISGLGQYELYLNGHKIGNHFLSPGWTNYLKSCLYNTWDVTSELKKGSNTIGVIVGNGFYNINRERYYKLTITYGAPKLITRMVIRYNDGTEEQIVSDESWKTAPSPVTFASIFGGEDYDARLEQAGWDKPGFNDLNWKNALTVRAPGGDLKPENDYPLKVMQEFDPVRIYHPDTSVFVYDFGQNASGIINLSVKGKEGQEVRLWPGELIGTDSLVAQRASGTPYYFSYTIKGDNEEYWTPRFTYYGFRYVRAEGAVPEGMPNKDKLPVITGIRMLHTRNSSPEAGSFECSSDHINSVYKLVNWAIKSNLASVATDCPHREKLGWLEQTHLMGNSIKYVYDIHNLFEKMIGDMMEAQIENGLVPDIAPEYVQFQGGFRDSPEWSSACIILPWDMYEWYGDIEAVRRAYPMMKRYLDYLGTMATGNILSHGLGDWYDLGPRSPGVSQLTPLSVTATAIYYYDAVLMGKMADLTGKPEDAVKYRNLAEEIRESFNTEFLDPKTKIYSTGSQTAYSMPLFFGMVDDTIKPFVVDNLVRSIIGNNKALTAGDVGYRYLLRALEQEGRSQLIWEMNSKTDVPGYGFQLSKGATALTESWAGLVNVSNNHMMLGHIMEWFYSGLAGIQQTAGSKGYEHILLKPSPVGDIKWVKASYNSIRGSIAINWKHEDGKFSMEIIIPPNTKATVAFPVPDPDRIKEGAGSLKTSESVRNIRVTGDRTYFEVVPGKYFFESVTE